MEKREKERDKKQRRGEGSGRYEKKEGKRSNRYVDNGNNSDGR